VVPLELRVLKTSEKVYWFKVVGALVTGAVCTYLNTYLLLQEHLTVMAGVSVYVALSESLAVMTGIDRNRAIKIGVGAFLFIWLFAWTLLNTVILTSA
jgi:hypothetical protein